MMNPKTLVVFLALSIFTVQIEAFADTAMTQFCFEMATPSNAESIQILNADGDPYLNEVIGTINFTVDYREAMTDPWGTAGTVSYPMQSDGAGFLINNSGVYTADFGGLISNVSQFRISMSVNAAEWQASALDPWSIDNVELKMDRTFLLAGTTRLTRMRLTLTHSFHQAAVWMMHGVPILFPPS